MIKTINPQNFLTTPFVAYKNWHLTNADYDSEDLVLLETTGSDDDADTVALEFIDYSNDPTGVGILNTTCSIALEQQDDDQAEYQEAITGSGTFFPATEPMNADGTFKRSVHSQIAVTFYNAFQNPLEIFGVEYIDFPLSRTLRQLSDQLRIFTIPQGIFGDKILEGSVLMVDTSLDDNVTIFDDGYQNLIAGTNLFSKVQEVRGFFGNAINNSFPPIATPINLSASFITTTPMLFTTNSIQLNWTNTANNQTGFGVQRSTDGVSWSLILLVSGSITQSYDPNVLLGVLYDYRVYAFNQNTQSNYSNIITAAIYGAAEPWDEYTNGQTTGFNSGSGMWSGSWEDDIIQTIVASDPFDEYTDGQGSNFNLGSGWTSPWTVTSSFYYPMISESFDEYADGQTGSFAGGTNWIGPWWV